jgi:hypothetical protein
LYSGLPGEKCILSAVHVYRVHGNKTCDVVCEQ